MDRIKFSIDSSKNEMLLGLHFFDCEAENINTGEIEYGMMFSIGFLFFSLNFFIKE